MKVLYVGYQPEKPLPEDLNVLQIGHLSESRFKQEYKTRYPAFMDYLNMTFTNVKGVDAREYKAEMSEGFDVTIFDQITNQEFFPKMSFVPSGQMTNWEFTPILSFGGKIEKQ